MSARRGTSKNISCETAMRPVIVRLSTLEHSYLRIWHVKHLSAYASLHQFYRRKKISYDVTSRRLVGRCVRDDGPKHLHFNGIIALVRGNNHLVQSAAPQALHMDNPSRCVTGAQATKL